MEEEYTDEAATRKSHGQSTNWRAIFNFTKKPHLIALIPAIALSLIAGILQPAMAIFFGKFFDAFSDFGADRIDSSELMRRSLISVYALIGIGAGTFVLKGGLFAAWLIFGEMQAKSIRDELFQGLLQRNIAWYESRPSGIGSLLTILQTQIRELQIGTSQPLGFSINYIIQANASLGIAFYYNWKLTFIILAGIPVTVIVLAFISHGLQRNIVLQDESLLRASKIANNAISNIVLIKCFNTQEEEARKYIQAIQAAGRFYVKQAMSNALQIGFVRFASTTMFIQGFWFGGSQVHSGSTTAGKVITTFWSCLMATKAFEDILPHILVLEKGKAAAVSLNSMLTNVKTSQAVLHNSGEVSPQFCEGDIEIRGISFCYPSRPHHPVLSDCSLFFPAGEITYVVGQSGSGKSTLGNLLMRFYNPSAGSVSIDGHRIEEIDLNWLRNNITLVQQQSILFNETIFRNIAFGNRDYDHVTYRQINSCLKLAALQETIANLPNGVDTRVGLGGSALSGGQKQRMAIARARLRNTPILILDESTSALDHINKNKVMNAIRRWRKDKTTIIITHDLDQIKEDDFVYALENGQVLAEGYKRDLDLDMMQSPVEPDMGNPKTDDLNRFNFKFDCQPTSIQSPLSYLTEQASVSRIGLPQNQNSPLIELKSLRTSSGHGAVGNNKQKLYKRLSFNTSAILKTVKRQSSMQGQSMYQSELAAEAQRQIDRSQSLRTRTARPLSMHQARMTRVMYQGILDQKKLPTPKIMETPQLIRRLSLRKNPPSVEEAQSTSIHEILQTVWPELDRIHRMKLVLGFSASIFHAACPPAFSYILVQLFATFYLSSGFHRKALVYSLAILGVAFVDALSSFLMHYALEDASQQWVDRLRIKAMKAVVDQPKSWFDEETSAASMIVSTLDRNAEDMRNLVGRFAAFIVVVVVMMFIAILWSFIKCWKVTLIGLAAAPLLYSITKGFETVSSKWESRMNTASEAINATFAETFSDIRTVRSLTLESYFHKKYTQTTTHAFSIGTLRAVYSGIFFGLSDSAINFVAALIFWFGAHVVKDHEFPVKSVLTVFSLLLFSTASANAIVAYMPQIASSVDMASRLLQLTQLPSISHEHNGHLRLDPYNPATLTGPIHFINHNFSYPTRPTVPALQSLNLTIAGGQCTAIVGPSGSGKSTIVSLLLGLYPPSSNLQSCSRSSSTFLTIASNQAASLTISGRDIRQLHLPTLRSMIAIVPQTPIIFPTSVRENICYGLSLSSELTTSTNIERAARDVGIHEFIESLPQGYATNIGEGGLGLSGGQAQRLVIARAIVRKPKILILDEATSALDQENAKLVRISLLNLIQTSNANGRRMTIIVITHAREMMQIADNVIMLENGQVVEEGKYRDLSRRRSRLFNMLNTEVNTADNAVEV